VISCFLDGPTDEIMWSQQVKPYCWLDKETAQELFEVVTESLNPTDLNLVQHLWDVLENMRGLLFYTINFIDKLNIFGFD